MTFLLRALLAIAALLTAFATSAQSGYPNRPIRLIVPLATGSAVDNAARILAPKMAEGLGQNIVIENIPGASGLIGADKVAKAPADGYTIGGFNDSVLTMVPHIVERAPWQALTDFEPLALVATIEWGIAVRPDSPYRTVGDLIAAARAAPAKLNYGSGGNGSPQHIGMALLMHRAGIEMTHVPYKGATPAAVAAASGEVDVTMQGLGTITALLQSGKLRLLAVSTPNRLSQYPTTPTVHESGLPEFYFNSWFAMVLPANTPKPITERLNHEVRKALADPSTRDKLVGLGLTIRGTSPEEMGRALKEQYAMYQKLIREKGIRE